MRVFPFISIRGKAAAVLGLLLLGGVPVPTADAQSVELSPAPPNMVQGRVAPNIVVTFDNSRPMFRTYSPQSRPFDFGDWNGPWKCAGVIDPRITDPADIRSHSMNSVYYNPTVRYVSPLRSSIPLRDADPKMVPDEGVAANRPRQPLGMSASPVYYESRMGTDSNGLNPDGRWQIRNSSTNLLAQRTVEAIPKTIVTQVKDYKYDHYYLCPTFSNAGLTVFGEHILDNLTIAPWSNPRPGAADYKLALGCACLSGWGNWTPASSYSRLEDFRRACKGTTQYRWVELVDVKKTVYEEKVTDHRWTCGADASSPLPGDAGGPYYYRYKQWSPRIEVDAQGKPTRTGLARLYDRSNWEAVRVDDTANFANWYAYYRTPSLMMRSVVSHAFGRLGRAVPGTGGGFGSQLRVAWQNVGAGDTFRLQGDAVIAPLIDFHDPFCDAAKVDPVAEGLQAGKRSTPLNCYNTAFFNWLFDDTKFTDTPSNEAIARARRFFERGNGSGGATGDLHDPYWEPPAQPGGAGKRLTCRQNFHMIVTDYNRPYGGESLGAGANVRTAFFGPGHPENLIGQIKAALIDIQAGTSPVTVSGANLSAVNTSVLAPGALGFSTGYDPKDWSGTFQAVSLSANGKASNVAWDAGDMLDKSHPAARNVLTGARDRDGRVKGVAFKLAYQLDAEARLLFADVARRAGTTDQYFLDYLRGDRGKEATAFRKRNHLLGAIVGAQAVHVGYPSSGYRDSWPANSPEQQALARDASDCARRTPSTCSSYEAFVKNRLNRKPAVYVGANDGMLHAFDASMTKDGSGNASPAASAGQELFAYVPRSVYANLGNLTLKDGFKFMPTVDGVPVTRDVYFSQSTTTPVATSPGWRTILVGGLRLGGRGVYALDITDPASMDAGKVLWEFSADTPRQNGWSDGRAVNPGGDPANLGYTYGQPNIGRLNNGSWVVLVPGGYFPDCGKAPFAGCTTPAQVANTFSSLFVLDAQTGKLIREVKTSDARSGTNSHGLATPVLGDYNDDQVDDVAFAGDLDGNLWRYDFSSSDPAAWKVTLAFKPVTAGTQPITGMPRLFPDPATSKLIVVFGTGKYLGPQDGSDVTTQSVYGIRDIGSTVTRSQLVAQTLREATADDGKITARGLTDHAVPSNKHGWYFDLGPSASSIGERVIVTPTALFDSGRVVIQTLIPGSDPCSGGVGGALMVVNAATGGSGGGLSSLSVSAWTGSGTAAVGGRVDNPRTASGTMPVVSAVGGGSLLVTGLKLSGSDSVLSIDDAIWRRRSWRRITP